jgi:tetratricopeptide (TPR) repeat protein
MHNSRLSRRFASFATALFMGGCTLGNATLADQQVENVATFSSPASYQMYNILAAEMYARQNNPGQAALHYVAAAQQSNDPAIARRGAELAINANDNALAARALDRWLKLEPASPDARQYRALMNLRAEHYDEAVKDLVAVRDDVEKKEGHSFEFIASLLALEPQAGKAYEVLKRYVAKEDTSPRAQLVLASMALNTDHFDDALSAAKTAKKTGSPAQKEQATRLQAKALLGLKRVPEALAEFESIVKTSKDPEVKLDYARTLILADRRVDAIPLFKQLYASQPDNADILYTLGLLYLEQKEYALAEPLIKKLQDDPGRAAEASYFMGQLRESQKRPKEALEAYQKAIGGHYTTEATGRIVGLMQSTQGLDASRAWLHTQLQAAATDEGKAQLLLLEGQLLHDQKQYKEAISLYDQAAKLKTDDVDILYSRSLSYEKLGDFKAAEADLQFLVKQQPKNATVLNALGYMLAVNTDRYAEAEALIRKALEIRPDDAAILDSMGWVLHRMGKAEEAETWLRKAYAKLPEPEVASHLVEVLLARGNTAEAKTVLQDMLGKFPDDPLLAKVKDKLVGL